SRRTSVASGARCPACSPSRSSRCCCWAGSSGPSRDEVLLAAPGSRPPSLPGSRLRALMHWLNWLIVIGWIAYVVVDGIRRTHNADQLEGFLLANRSLPWWAVGLSVMATQLSAVTMIGTTAQGATDGLRFVQFYFGLPLAMVIIGVTLVPFLHGAKVYTAYEYLERRFDAKTRSLTAFLFLISRGMS